MRKTTTAITIIKQTEKIEKKLGKRRLINNENIRCDLEGKQLLLDTAAVTLAVVIQLPVGPGTLQIQEFNHICAGKRLRWQNLSQLRVNFRYDAGAEQIRLFSGHTH